MSSTRLAGSCEFEVLEKGCFERCLGDPVSETPVVHQQRRARTRSRASARARGPDGAMEFVLNGNNQQAAPSKLSVSSETGGR